MAVVQDRRGNWFPVILPLILFLTVTAISGQFAVAFVVVALILAVGREPMALLGQRASLLTAGVVVYSALYLCSGLWSHFGAYAREESIKALVALALFGLVLARVRKTGVRGLLWSLNGVLALVGLLCIDASSWKVLSGLFSKLMGLFASLYDPATMGYEVGVRITGIYSNANVSAGILAFGLIVSLYLLQTEEKEKGRLLAGLTLGIQALAFFLSFSMGAMGAFAVTCLVYLVCVGKEGRLRLFFLRVESVLVTLVCAFVRPGHLGPGPLCGPSPGCRHGQQGEGCGHRHWRADCADVGLRGGRYEHHRRYHPDRGDHPVPGGGSGARRVPGGGDELGQPRPGAYLQPE